MVGRAFDWYVDLKRALCILEKALCILKRALCIIVYLFSKQGVWHVDLKRALCIRERARCILKKTLCILKRALCFQCVYIVSRAFDMNTPHHTRVIVHADLSRDFSLFVRGKWLIGMHNVPHLYACNASCIQGGEDAHVRVPYLFMLFSAKEPYH